MKKSMIRKLLPTDIPLIINYLSDDRFDCCEFNDFWSIEELTKWFNNSSDICIGCFHGEKLLGFCLSHFFKEASKVYLENIFVDSKYRKCGIASAMIKNIIKRYCDEKTSKLLRFVALVEATNQPAIASLKKEGFNVGNKMLWIQKNCSHEEI